MTAAPTPLPSRFRTVSLEILHTLPRLHAPRDEKASCGWSGLCGGFAASGFRTTELISKKRPAPSRGGRPATEPKPLKARRALKGGSRSKAKAHEELDNTPAGVARPRDGDVAVRAGGLAEGRAAARGV